MLEIFYVFIMFTLLLITISYIGVTLIFHERLQFNPHYITLITNAEITFTIKINKITNLI